MGKKIGNHIIFIFSVLLGSVLLVGFTPSANAIAQVKNLHAQMGYLSSIRFPQVRILS
jgi:hypothetical protein